MLTIRHITAGGVQPLTRADLAATLPTPGYVWVDLAAPTDAEEGILVELGIHPLVIEDMREDQHLPKLDVFGDELALTVHGLAIDAASDDVTTVELDIVLRADLLVTFHEGPLPSVSALADRLDERGPNGMSRPVLLLHRLLDTMNDILVPFVDHFERRLDVVEEDLLSTPTEQTRFDLYRMQRDVIHLRRVVVPQAEVIRRLGRDTGGLVSTEDQHLFQDVYDHLFRITEMSESYRQLLDSAMTSYRSAQDDKLNDMLRVLTLVSAVLLPITVIAGIYGTNFEFMPELDWRPGYFVMLGTFATIISGMLLWFRHRGWLGQRAERAAADRRRALAAVLEVPVLGSVFRVPVAGVRAVTRTGRRWVNGR
jgi:magnesium transporter